MRNVSYCARLLLRRDYGRADFFRFERKPDATVLHCSELLLRRVYGRADYFVSGGANAAERA